MLILVYDKTYLVKAQFCTFNFLQLATETTGQYVQFGAWLFWQSKT